MKINKLWFDDKHTCIETDAGKVGKLPLDDFPKLKFATKEQRNAYGPMNGDNLIDGILNPNKANKKASSICFFIMKEFVPKIFYLLLYADKKIILRLK